MDDIIVWPSPGHLDPRVSLVENTCAVLSALRTRSEEHTSNSSHSQISYAVFCLKKKNAERGIDWFRNHVVTKVPFPHPGVLRDVYPWFLQLNGFISMNLDRHLDAHTLLFKDLVQV